MCCCRVQRRRVMSRRMRYVRHTKTTLEESCYACSALLALCLAFGCGGDGDDEEPTDTATAVPLMD